MSLGAAITVVSLLPVFLTSALVVQMTEDLAFGTVGLGALVALNRAFAAATSPWIGRLTDQLGAIRAMRIGGMVAIACSLGVALATTNWWALAFWLTLAGGANVFAQTAANRLLSNNVPPNRLGTAFGMKQSAPPIAAMLAGLSVPIIGVTIGWRWAFVFSAAIAVFVVLAAGAAPERVAQPAEHRRDRTPLPNRKILWVLAIAFGFGNFSSAAVTTFYVDAAVRDGTTPEVAGSLLALASACAIATRITMGIVSDRMMTGHLRTSGVQLAVGSIGILLLSQGGTATMGAGVIIALAGTWGFNGVFWYALVRAYPTTPGRVTGAVFPGGLIGGTLGPTAFGVLAAATSYPTAWRLTAIAPLTAAVMMTYASGQLARGESTAQAGDA